MTGRPVTERPMTERPTPAPAPWADPYFTVGVTGTNGKTSTAFLISAILRHAGLPHARITTLGYDIARGGERAKGRELRRTQQNFLATLQVARRRGARHAVVEATSQALAAGYARQWRFDAAIFTNLSPDHLTTHGTFEDYLAAKAQLFVHLGPGGHAVLNAGDPCSQLLAQVISPDVSVHTFAGPGADPSAADLRIAEVQTSLDGTAVSLVDGPAARQLEGGFELSLHGTPFAENAAAAALMGLTLGIPGTTIRRAFRDVAVPGRFEVVHRPERGPAVVVDYAHTPDALARTLETARACTRGRTWLVFGAGGGATPEKRGPMGELAGTLCDEVIVTSDNPRDEDPLQIAEALAEGARRGSARVRLELERREATAAALREAEDGDLIVLAGKGHETGQTARGVTVPYSDRETVATLVGDSAGSAWSRDSADAGGS